jgi:hypothetical protein
MMSSFENKRQTSKQEEFKEFKQRRIPEIIRRMPLLFKLGSRFILNVAATLLVALARLSTPLTVPYATSPKINFVEVKFSQLHWIN